jgi:predicted ATPase
MDYIKIKGYKSIKEIELKMKPLNILIGANGSGKSNFMSFFDFLNAVYERRLKEYVALRGGAEKMLHKGTEATTQIEFEISFDNENNGYKVVLEKGDEHFIFMKEFLVIQKEYDADIANLQDEAYIKSTDNFRAKYVIRYLKSYRKYHFHDTGRNSPFNRVSNILNDQYYLYDDGSNLAAYLYYINLYHKKIYSNIIRNIQSVAPYFLDFFLQPNSENLIRLQWKSKHSSVIYGASDLSDGTIRFIALTVLFMQPSPPSSIIIDEPELGLHPFAISKLAGMVKSVASKGVQVIIATQSADLVNHFQPEDIITVDQIDGESRFRRLDAENLEEWLDSYSIGDLWQRNIITGGQPNN